MSVLKRIFDFYLNASIHVALAVFALVRMTQHQFALESNDAVAWFAFFGTVVGYNFVKYDALARVRGLKIERIRRIAAISVLCFVGALICFFQLTWTTKLMSAGVLVLTTLYTLPFFPNRRNARNWAGLKIYIVALCWVGVTLMLPLIDGGATLTTEVMLKCIQRFILIFVLILIFEIIDLSKDDPHLQTVPQQIGVKRTKTVAITLLVVFYLLELLRLEPDPSQLLINAALVVITSAFTFFANEQRSRYYTAFWVESIPILWWMMMVGSNF